MLRIALGWFGWTEQQALDADVNAIQMAYEGRLEYLELTGVIHRKEKPEPQDDGLSAVEWMDRQFG